MAEAPSSQNVIIGLSGGVDSAVAAKRLLDQGYQVEAMFMKNWNEDDGTEYCTARADLEDALRICDRLGIELHAVNFAADYWDNVFEYFLVEYRAGRTPNPDVLCNREIKFKVFLDHARKLGADRIATGHYAQTQQQDDETWLLKGVDENKDQSYFLHAVSQEQLAMSLFPLGNSQKPEIRQQAFDLGLHVHDKKDSTGICFIGERRFRDFLQNYLPAQPGPVYSAEGQLLGEHNGLMYHTIGQRQGLGIGGVNGASEQPWYVADKQVEDNTLIVVQGNNHPLLFREKLIAGNPHWINQRPAMPLECHAKIRYRQADQRCRVTLSGNNDSGNPSAPIDGEQLEVEFEDPQRAITPGQYIVFYDGNRCLGGATIL